MLYRLLIILPPITNFIQKIFGNTLALKFINKVTDKERFFYIKEHFDNIQQKKVQQLAILLPGKGCSWAKESGGCTMCALYQKANEFSLKLTDYDLIVLYKLAVILTKKINPETIIIYNGGSFLNQKEINYKTQNKIIRLVSQHPTVKKLFIESRPEYINEEHINKFKSILNKKILQIGIGLEAIDDHIRNKLINKGILIESYNKSINILKKNNVASLTYTLIKPIGITEKESIEEAIKTAKFVFKSGGDEVAFEASFIQPATTMAMLYKAGLYKPPWLWSILKIIMETYNDGKISIGEFDDTPPPIASPSNCIKCNNLIKNALDDFRKSHDLNHIKSIPFCECYNNWLKEVGIENKINLF
jgi:archaeosine synthase beta-subunit